MSFVKVAHTDQIPPGTMGSFKIKGKMILVTNLNGKFYAVRGTCEDHECDLSKGSLKDNIVRCPKHWLPIDVTNGKSLFYQYSFIHYQPPDIPCYEVKVSGNIIRIKI
jgi:3-phenylpropionate/trans-cinnamate dioxygenase ferredoxin subunit